MNNEIKGKIIKIEDVQEFSGGFKKRTVVIDDGDQWPNPVPVEFVKEKADDFNGQVGDVIRCDLNIRGREWNDRYFVNVQCWRWEIEKGGDNVDVDPAPEPSPSTAQDDEEMPF